MLCPLFIICIVVVLVTGCTSSNNQTSQSSSGNPGLLGENPIQDYDVAIHNVTTLINHDICSGEFRQDCIDSNFIIIDISVRENINKRTSSGGVEYPVINYNDFYLEDMVYHSHYQPEFYTSQGLMDTELRDSMYKAGLFPENLFPGQVIQPVKGEVIRGYLIYHIPKDEIDSFSNSSRLLMKKPVPFNQYINFDSSETVLKIPDIYKTDYKDVGYLVPHSKPSPDIILSINSVTKFYNSHDLSQEGEIGGNGIFCLDNYENYAYIISDISITNNKNTPVDLGNYTFSIKDTDNHYYSRDTGDLNVPNRLNLKVKLQPGESIRGKVSFLINKKTQPYELWMRGWDDYYSTPVTGF